MFNYKIFFRPICWIIEVYYAFRHKSAYPISGHSFVQCDDGTQDLQCEVCGIFSVEKKHRGFYSRFW